MTPEIETSGLFDAVTAHVRDTRLSQELWMDMRFDAGEEYDSLATEAVQGYEGFMKLLQPQFEEIVDTFPLFTEKDWDIGPEIKSYPPSLDPDKRQIETGQLNIVWGDHSLSQDMDNVLVQEYERLKTKSENTELSDRRREKAKRKLDSLKDTPLTSFAVKIIQARTRLGIRDKKVVPLVHLEPIFSGTSSQAFTLEEVGGGALVHDLSQLIRGGGGERFYIHHTTVARFLAAKNNPIELLPEGPYQLRHFIR
jgi:hypothetical protein